MRPTNTAVFQLAKLPRALALGAVFALAASGAARAQSAVPVKIRFGEISTAASHAPLYAAVNEGFFKKAGLDVEIQVLSGGTPSAMAAVATGSIDIMMSGSTEFVEYTAKKVISAKLIGEMQDSTFDLVVLKDINSVQELKGKILGVSAPNAGDQVWLNAMLVQYGMSAKDVQFLTTGNPVNRLTAMGAGAVHAIAAANSNRDVSEKVGKILIKSADSPVKIPNSIVFATNAFLAKNKDATQKFVKALGDATVWVKANPQPSAVYCSKGTGGTVDACLSGIKALTDPAVVGKYTWSSTYAIDPVGIKSAMAVVQGYAQEAKELQYENLVDTSIAGTAP